MEVRPIPSAPGYAADSLGRIINVRRNRVMIGGRPKTGYRTVTVSLHGKAKTFLVHRLVLEAFKGPCPPGCECRHLDGVRTNNRPDNLEWGSKKENAADRDRHGRTHKGSSHYRAKLSEELVLAIREMRSEGVHTNREIAEHFEVEEYDVINACSGKSWKHVALLDDPTRYRLTAAGERSHFAKLDVEKVRKIRAMAAAREKSYRLIGEQFGITKRNVVDIVSRRIWKKV